MKSKLALFFFSALILVNLPTTCFFNNGNSNALTGAAIGGLAGGRKGAGIGFATGVGLDFVSAAANRNRGNYYYDEDYESRSDLKRTIQMLKKENRDLQRQVDMLSKKLDDCKRRLKKRS